MYKCECGREFEASQSYVAHCGHCKEHLGYEPKDRFAESRRKSHKHGGGKKFSLDDILSNKVPYQTNHLKWRLIEEGYKEYKCEMCGFSEWLGHDIPIELHHIDGDNKNNNLDNLQILCPNCHTFTDNYRWNAARKNGSIP